MRIKNKEHLIQMLDVLYKEYPDKDLDFFKIFMAVEMLRIMIDNEWVNQSLFSLHNKLEKSNRDAFYFFKSDSINIEWKERVFKLAERIYNLRNIKNIDLLINDIKNGELVSRYAEIEVGKHLLIRHLNFEYIKPSGTKGMDYDIKILDEIEINCEVKHKFEQTEFSNKTIEKSLSKANKQLPKDNYALIFIKFPAEWSLEDDFLDKIQNACNSFLIRNSEHLLAIGLRWQDPIINGMQGWRYQIIKNINFKHNQTTLNFLNKLNSAPNNNDWLNLHEFIDRQLYFKKKL